MSVTESKVAKTKKNTRKPAETAATCSDAQ